MPSSFDNTTATGCAEYFPTIGDQKDLPCCGVFASVRYAYTYTANKHQGITTTEANTYSPKWAYNSLNGCNNGVLHGTTRTDVLAFLREHGALKEDDFPYSGDKTVPANYEELPSAALSEEMLESLQLRLAPSTSDINEVNKTRTISFPSVKSDGTAMFTSVSCNAINQVKQLIADGNVLLTSTMIKGWVAKYSNQTVGNVGIRTCYGDNSWHGGVIVGYDDNVKIDVNGDGVYQDGEKGAFKIANTWGTDWGFNDGVSQNPPSVTKNGYYWILYDSLNGVTSIPGNWESDAPFSGSRTPAFSRYVNNNNTVTILKVQEYPVHYAAKVTITAANRSSVDIEVGYSDNYSYVSTGYSWEDKFYLHNESGQLSCNNLVIFYDLGVNANKITEKEYYWIRATTDDSTSVSYSFSFVDTENTMIPSTVTLAQQTLAWPPIDLSYLCKRNIICTMGDMDYNGKLEQADISVIMSYITGSETFSTLQLYLADWNGDGQITTADVVGFMGEL